MLECVVHLSNNIAAKRCIPDSNIFETLAALTAVVQRCRKKFGSPPSQVLVRRKPLGVRRKRKIHFTNICGKIGHLPGRRIYQPGVEPMVRSVSNGFGKFKGLYSRYTNLLTCTTKTSTLFRGGRSSKAIQKVVQHAINPSNIDHMSVHMLVASASLGHGVCMNSHFLDRHVCQDPRWKCVIVPQHEEMAYVKSLRLTNFDPAFVSEMDIDAPDSVVASVSKNGSVSLFATFSDVKFQEKIEHKYKPFLKHMIRVIRAGS